MSTTSTGGEGNATAWVTWTRADEIRSGAAPAPSSGAEVAARELLDEHAAQSAEAEARERAAERRAADAGRALDAVAQRARQADRRAADAERRATTAVVTPAGGMWEDAASASPIAAAPAVRPHRLSGRQLELIGGALVAGSVVGAVVTYL